MKAIRIRQRSKQTEGGKSWVDTLEEGEMYISVSKRDNPAAHLEIGVVNYRLSLSATEALKLRDFLNQNLAPFSTVAEAKAGEGTPETINHRKLIAAMDRMNYRDALKDSVDASLIKWYGADYEVTWEQLSNVLRQSHKMPLGHIDGFRRALLIVQQTK